jgi:hypothetical protein
MVDVTVREHDRRRSEAILAYQVSERLDGVLAGIDDQARLTSGSRHKVTIRPEGAGRKPDDEHDRPLSWTPGVGRTGLAKAGLAMRTAIERSALRSARPSRLVAGRAYRHP